MAATTVEILLATFNGAKFLGDLLGSLARQEDQGWTLVVRDDGSTDGSQALLSSWAEAHPGRLRWIQDGHRRLGPMGNFEALLAASSADYFLLCDQDDVWLPQKVRHLRESVYAAEAQYGRKTPIIVHSDLIPTDASLRPIAESYWHYQRMVFPESNAPWKVLALSNVVTGGATIGNAALRHAALPIPKEAMMHDWWLALTAATMGKIVKDSRPSTLYRQHGQNTLGAKSWKLRDGLIRATSNPRAAMERTKFIIEGTRKQAQAMLENCGDQLAPEASGFLREYAELGGEKFLARKIFPFRHRLRYGDAIRNIAFLLFI